MWKKKSSKDYPVIPFTPFENPLWCLKNINSSPQKKTWIFEPPKTLVPLPLISASYMWRACFTQLAPADPTWSRWIWITCERKPSIFSSPVLPPGRNGLFFVCVFCFAIKLIGLGEIVVVEVGLSNEDVIFCENQNVVSRSQNGHKELPGR